MKSISLMCVATLLGLASMAQAQTWNIGYGTTEGKVAYYNSSSDPDFAEDQPFGPMSFRVTGDRLWVLDSVAGKLASFDENGKCLSTITVPGLEGFKLLEDFALIGDENNPEAVWIANAADSTIRKISLDDGKVLATIGGSNGDEDVFLQIHQMETDVAKRLYVADIAKNVIVVFSATGEYLREIPWQSSGMVVDRFANLHILHYSDKAGYFHRVYSDKGTLVKNTHLGFVKNTNGKILAVENDDSIIVSFIPAEGFKGKLNMLRLSADGMISEKLEYAPTTMNRVAYVNNGKVYVAEADFENAPKGNFTVKTLKWDEKKPEGAVK